MLHRLILLLCTIVGLLHAEPDNRLILSDDDQIATIREPSNLIDGLISPLSGQACLSYKDLVVKGVQSISLNRHYIAPHMPSAFGSNRYDMSVQGDQLQRECLYAFLNAHYQGWVILPHLRLAVTRESPLTVRLAEPYGIVLDLEVSTDGSVKLVGHSYGLTNTSGETPSGAYDIRNTRVYTNSTNQTITVTASDGVVRIYQKQVSFYLLSKEVLLNGHVIRYSYENDTLCKIESLDPLERYVYAAVEVVGSPEKGFWTFTSSTGLTSSYHYTTRSEPLVYRKGKQRGKDRLLKSPPILVDVKGPLCRNETNTYSNRFCLMQHEHDGTLLTCEYGPTPVPEYKPYLRVFQIRRGAGQAPKYTMEYNAAVGGIKGGSTTVKSIEGTTTIYDFSQQLLPISTRYYNPDGALAKKLTYHWSENQWLEHTELTDEQDNLVYRKSYEYDTFGNPIKEVLWGNLSGEGAEAKTITRSFSQDGKHLLLEEKHDCGKTIRWQYLANTNLPLVKTIEDGARAVESHIYEYDDCNHLIKKRIESGQKSTITNYILRQEQPFLHMPEWIEECYIEDEAEQLLSQRHLTYDSFGNVCQKDFYDGARQHLHSISRSYDTRGNLLSETNAIGQKATHEYDDFGQDIVSISHSNSLRTERAYDAFGNVTSEVVSGEGFPAQKTTFIYDTQDRLIGKEDHRGHQYKYHYDPIVNQVTKTEYPAIMSHDGTSIPVITASTYHAIGHETSKTDANGNKTLYERNILGSITKIIHPDNTQEQYRYTNAGVLKSYRDQEGNTTLYSYDPAGRLLSKQYLDNNDAQVAEENFTYDGFLLTQKIDKEGYRTSYSYDGAGRLISKDHHGRLTHYQYDSQNRVIKETHVNGAATLAIQHQRDALGRVITKIESDAADAVLRKTSYAYDIHGNQTTTTHWMGDQPCTHTVVYDALKRPIEKKDALGSITTFQYEEGKKLRKISASPKGVITTSILDAYEHEIERVVQDQDKNVLSHIQKDYDAQGNLITHHDIIHHNGMPTSIQTIAYAYTSMNKVRTVTRAAGTPVARTTEYRYYPDGSIAQKIKPDGISLHYSYDAFRNLKTLSASNGLLSHSFVHNRLGYLLQAKDELANTSITREVDAFGNIVSERFPSGFTVTRKYDDYNRPLTVQYSTRWAVTYGYDPRNLQQVAFRGTDGRVYTHRYEQYNECGRPLQEQLIANLGTRKHEYDLKGRQVSLKGPFMDQTCFYDEEDNLVSSLVDEASTTYGYDALSQLITENNHHTNAVYENDSNYNRVAIHEQPCVHNELSEVLSTPEINCSYDLNGNLVERGAKTYRYDPLDKLIQAEFDNTKIEFNYDALGRRLGKTSFASSEDGWQVVDREEYLYDGNHDVGALDRDGNLKQKRILSFLGGTPIPETVAIELSGKTFSCRVDVQGNIRGLIDPVTKTIATNYDYTAFGTERRINLLEVYQSPWRYASKRFDADLGLINFGKRDYDPILGRWTTTDPAGFVDSTNLYAYLYNNPFRYVDPDGRLLVYIPIVMWGGAAGLAWVVPSITSLLATTLTYFIFQEACIMYDRYQLNQMYATKYREEDYPGSPDDLSNNPDWKETTRPEARESGRRVFENDKTGEKIEYDKGKPDKNRHGANDHYHRRNPNGTSSDDKYLNATGDSCGKNDDSYHLYPPEGVTWEY